MRQPERAEKRARRAPARALALSAILMLTACSVPDAVNPISWYRDLSGASKNDSLDKDQRNQQNLEAGGKQPYPNLADVPDVPDRALSTIDRDKLQKSLVADRANAQYTDQQLRADLPSPNTVPPPAPLAPPSSAQADATPSAPAAAAPAAQAGPEPAPTQAAAPATPAQASAPAQAATPPAPAQAPAPAAAQAPAAAAAAPASGSAPAADTTAVAQQPRRPAPPVKGSEAPPQESPLVSPSIVNVPTGQTPPPASPPPNVGPATMVAATPAIKPPTAVPPPQAPAVAPTAPPPPANQVAVAGEGQKRGAPAVTFEVGEITFTAGSAALPSGQNGALADIVKLHQQNGGTLRVVGYAERGTTAAGVQQQLDSFTLALDRAKAVGTALADAGVAADQIAVEAAPSVPGREEAPRVEVFVER